MSATSLVHRYMEPFDPVGTAARSVAGKHWSASRYRAGAEREACAALVREQRHWLAHVPEHAQPAFASYVEHTGEPGAASLDAVLGALAGDEERRRRLLEDVLWPRWIAYLVREYARAGEYGTAMHTQLERFFNGELSLDGVRELARTGHANGSGAAAHEYAHFERFLHEWLAPRNLRPFRMELKIFDALRRICGSTDALFSDPEYDDGLHLILLGKRARAARLPTQITSGWAT